MDLNYKPDWEEARARMVAWWNGEALSRCCLAVRAPRDGAPETPPPEAPDDPVTRWTDLDYFAASNRWVWERTFYGGEAFPAFHAGYPGTKNLPVFMGCSVDIREDTAWVEPILFGEELDVSDLRLDRGSRWFQHALEAQKRAVAESQGLALPAFVCALGGCGDTLAWLRGTERLLLDVVLQPERVLDAEMRLMELWIEVYGEFYEIFRHAAEGATSWFPIWGPGRCYATHNDFAYNISPDQFRQCFLPALERQCHYLEYAVHHLDGEGNFIHADAICEVEGLRAIQVLPGAGKSSPLHYMDLLQRIVSRGKGLHLTVPPEDVEPLLRELPANQLFLETHCDSEEEARVLLRQAEVWSR